jgi:hypothetical protein
MGGTRFNARGLDTDGNAANFIETEVIIELPSERLMFSHFQIRGSMPLAWKQSSSAKQKISLNKSVSPED